MPIKWYTMNLCMLFNSWWHEPPNMKQSNTLEKIQYLNYITGIPVLHKILKKNHNTGTNFYTSIVHNTSIPVLRSPSTGDPKRLGHHWHCHPSTNAPNIIQLLNISCGDQFVLLTAFTQDFLFFTSLGKITKTWYRSL
jgi:hypothetical protein